MSYALTDGRSRLTREWRGRVAVVCVSGEIDMLTAPRLDETTSACLNDRPTGMVIDLSETEFLASAGINALVHACAQAGDRGVAFAVAADSASTSRPIELLGLADSLHLYPTLDHALAFLSGGAPI